MTLRLYYDSPDQDFDATVIEVTPRDGRAIVVLDRTAFYPTSGGQPFDTGMLGDDRVVEVAEREDGVIEHVVGGETGYAVGQRVHGRIDMARRFDHMQQHTGQHVLSAAFERLHGVQTESFHLGSVSSTIDLGREVAPGNIAHAEFEANRIVWEDRVVSIRYASAEEAAALPLRKPPATRARESLRLIEITDFDLSACGGTHVSRTGRIGMVAVAAWERFKRGTRVEFVCGVRALEYFRRQRDALSASIKLLSVAPGELAEAIARAQTDSKELRRELKRMQEKIASADADALFRDAPADHGVMLVARALDGYDSAGLRSLVVTAAAASGRVAIVCSTTRPVALAIGRSKDVPLDAGALLRTVMDRFGGRGGGNRELAQGGGIDAAAEDVLAEAAQLVRTELQRKTKTEERIERKLD